jgi:predicted metalloprotease with PDZ domain
MSIVFNLCSPISKLKLQLLMNLNIPFKQRYYKPLLSLTFTLFTFTAFTQNAVQVTMDLNAVSNDRVAVTVAPPKIKTDETIYFVPKIIPGTYSEDDYGRFIENMKAFDSKGKELSVAKMDDNSWTIKEAKKLAKITYWVNDTYDIENTHNIFSPAGTNIEKGKNFMINTHGFIGYFKNLEQLPYQLNITKPATLYGATALIDKDPTDTKDIFTTSRYADLVDSPIMYSQPNYATFKADSMEILLSVYSPNGIYTAQSLVPEMEKMMKAQKNFLGLINNTEKYAILLYLSDIDKADATGYGALEHNTSTTVVFPEAMPEDQLIQSLIDVVSHEFFHIVTPLSVHSKEIHFFDFNTPKMSQHLWMYEGITEYFANLFQINQELIDENDFYNRIAEKIQNAKRFDDTLPFTKMSANVLSKPNKDNYLNVYEKGTLIAMCMDIIIRENSNGERGILDLMHKLSKEYGNAKPFNDDELFDKIGELTCPEVRKFLDIHVSGNTPIDYVTYFKKVGVTFGKTQVPGHVFLDGQTPYITVDPTTKEISILPGMPLNNFMNQLGLQNADVILAVNDVNYNLENIYDLIMTSMSWKNEDAVTFKIKRKGKESTLKGKVIIPTMEIEGLIFTDSSKEKLKEAWLKGPSLL